MCSPKCGTTISNIKRRYRRSWRMTVSPIGKQKHEGYRCAHCEFSCQCLPYCMIQSSSGLVKPQRPLRLRPHLLQTTVNENHSLVFMRHSQGGATTCNCLLSSPITDDHLTSTHPIHQEERNDTMSKK